MTRVSFLSTRLLSKKVTRDIVTSTPGCSTRSATWRSGAALKKAVTLNCRVSRDERQVTAGVKMARERLVAKSERTFAFVLLPKLKKKIFCRNIYNTLYVRSSSSFQQAYSCPFYLFIKTDTFSTNYPSLLGENILRLQNPKFVFQSSY